MLGAATLNSLIYISKSRIASMCGYFKIFEELAFYVDTAFFFPYEVHKSSTFFTSSPTFGIVCLCAYIIVILLCALV